MITPAELASKLQQRAQQGRPFQFLRMRCFDFHLIRPGDMAYRITDARMPSADILILVVHDGPGLRSELHLDAPSDLSLTDNTLTVRTARKLRFRAIELWSEQNRFHYRDEHGQSLLEPSAAPLLSLLD